MRIGHLLFMLTCPLVTGCAEDITGGATEGTGVGSGSSTDPSGSEAAGSNATGSGPTAYDQEILAVAATYKGSAFSKINSQPYTSTVGTFQINVYAYGDVTNYRAIHPETTSTMTIGVGTVIVREVLDAAGAVSSLTMIAKAPAGYDATLGDWWFAETDPSGAAMVTDGTLQVGKLVACHSCHVPRETDDYLFGVPKAMQSRNH